MSQTAVLSRDRGHVVRRRVLQFVVTAVALIALVTSVIGLWDGMSGDFYLQRSGRGTTVLDSNLRYFSGLWLGVGAVLLWIVPAIERHRALLSAVALMVFLGGLGRVVSIIQVGLPPTIFVVFTGLELVFPVLLLLHARVSVRPVIDRASGTRAT